MMRIRGLIAVALVALVFASCVKRPKGVLSDSDMVPVLADLQIAEAYMQTQPHEGGVAETRARLLAWTLEKHGIDRADFDSTMAY